MRGKKYSPKVIVHTRSVLRDHCSETGFEQCYEVDDVLSLIVSEPDGAGPRENLRERESHDNIDTNHVNLFFRNFSTILSTLSLNLIKKNEIVN